MKGPEEPKPKQRKRKKGKSLNQLMKERFELERQLDEYSLAEYQFNEALMDAALLLEVKRKPFYIR